MRRALVSLPDGVWKVIDEELKGKIGDGDSEVIRNIVIAHLMEKGYLLAPKIPKQGEKQVTTEQIATELDMHDSMIEALAELLEEKGNLNYSEWENRIRKKIDQDKSKVAET